METTTFEIAISKARELPEEAREQLGRNILFQIDKAKRLRADLQIGIDQLDAGEGTAIDIADVIQKARRCYGESV
jgi:hypothetical protein